jgi:hypothetical protein
LDREGEYTVIATDGGQVTIERTDGRRTVADASLKARIHRNLIIDRDADLGSDRSRKRRQPTRRERGLIERILRFEADGGDHSGAEIDQLLEGAARDLGYSNEDLAKKHTNGRSVFLNEGDFAKAKMTEDRWHEVVGKIAYGRGDARRECNVYRITLRGLDELSKLG